jgi:hypothetical protein
MEIKFPRFIIFTFLMMLLTCEMFAQSIGDYKSNINTTGIWSTSGSWQKWDGSNYVTTSTYPGQNSEPLTAVLIQEGQTITIDSRGITSQPMGTLTINGILELNDTGTDNNVTDYFFNTQNVIVTQTLSPYAAYIRFNNKVNFKLPLNATLQVFNGGLQGDCSNNQNIYIGAQVFSCCNGGDNSTPTFDQIMLQGGSINAVPTSNSPVCYQNDIVLTGNKLGLSNGANNTYNWSIKNVVNNVLYTSSNQNYTVINAPVGLYSVTLRCTTDYGGRTYTNEETISVAVNTLPVAPTASAQSFCGVGTIASLVGIVPLGSVLDWYATASGGSAIPSTTDLSSTTYYGESRNTTTGYLSATRTAVVVTVNTLPVAPAAVAAQSFCGIGTIASLVGTVPVGSVISWYGAASGGSAISSATALSSITYYGESRNTTTGCLSATRTAVVVTLNALPVTPAAASAQSFCGSGTITSLVGTAPVGSVISWYASASGGSAIVSATALSSTTYYGESRNTTTGCTSATRTSVVVTVHTLPNNTTDGFVATTICMGGSLQLTFDAEDSSFSTPYSISYKNTLTKTIYTVSIPNPAPFIFAPGDNPTISTEYTLLSINKAGCERTTGFGKTLAELRIRPTPTVLITSSTSAVCVGSTSPTIVISNPQTNQITVTYSINNIVATSVDIGAVAQISIPVSTTTAGNFIYRLISVVYKFSPSCPTALSANVTVVINPEPTLTASAQSFCGIGTIASLVGTAPVGSVIDWYAAALGGSVISSTTALSSTTYYGESRNTTTGCLSATRTAIVVTVNSLPVAPTATGQSFCGSGTIVSLVGTAPVGSVIDWYAAASGASVISPATALSSTTYYGESRNTTTGCISATRTAIVVTVNPLPVAPTTSAQSFCGIGTIASLVGTASVGSVIDWYAAALGGAVISSTTALSTTAYYGESRNTTTGCLSATRTAIVVTVNPLPAAPTVGAITQPNCVAEIGSFTITNYDSSNTYIFSPSIGVIRTNAAVTAPPGNYIIKASKGSCISSVFINVSILNKIIQTTTWMDRGLLGGGLGWSNGFPSINSKIIFEALYNSNSDTNVTSSLGEISGCSCEVKDNVQVTISKGHTLNVVNEVKVSVTGGTLLFENNASLVQINDAAINSGDITYNRAIPAGILNTDYVYWSTPVAEAKLAAIQTGTLYYSFSAPNNSWTIVNETTKMTNGVGYIVRGAGKAGTILLPALSPRTAVFKGIPNNGVQTVNNVVAGKNNLIGNPYPSAIDADKFLTENSGVLDGTIYFWTHNTAIQSRLNILATAGSGALAYTSNDYASYNITGGVGTSAEAIKAISAPLNDINNYRPTGRIAAGQGFFAGSKNNGKVEFNNSMRLLGGVLGVNNSQFFKIPENPKTTNFIDKNRVWLNLTNTRGAFKQTLIGYITGATNEYENAYDGISFNGNAFVDFYSINKNTNLVIQGRALPFDKNDAVPLGYRTTIAGDFKIAIDQTDGFLINNKIYLEDKLLGKIQDLKEAPYNFSTAVGTFNDRFVLTYAIKTFGPTTALGTEDYEKASEFVLISNKNNEIKVSSTAHEIDKVFVYDLSGRQIFMKLKVNKNELIINSIVSSEQVFMVKVVLQNKSTVTKKIIY